MTVSPRHVGPNEDVRFKIATVDADPKLKATAHLDLSDPAISSIGAELNTVFEDYTNFLIMGATIQLDVPVVVNHAVNIVGSHTTIINPQSLAATGPTRPAGFKIQGSTTALTGYAISGSTLTKGSNTITFTTLPSPTLAVDDYIQIQTSEIRDAAKSESYYKGEILRIETIVGNVVQFREALEESYTVSSLTLKRVNMLENVQLKNLKFASHATATNRQENLVLLYANGARLENVTASGDRTAYGLGIWASLNTILKACKAEKVIDVLNPAASGQLGYGLYLGGCQNTTVKYFTGRGNKNSIGIGSDPASQLYPVSRYTIIEDSGSYGDWGAAFVTRNAVNTTFDNPIIRFSGAGFDLRGSINRVLAAYIEGSHTEKPSAYSYYPTLPAGIVVGEDNATTLNRSGTAGDRLILKDFTFIQEDVATQPLMNAILINESVNEGYIKGLVRPTGDVLSFTGDKFQSSTVNFILDGNALRTGSGTVKLIPTTTTPSSPQYIANNTFKIQAVGPKTTLLQIGGGKDTGISQNNLIEITNETPGSGFTSSTPCIIFGAGTHGKQLIQKLVSRTSNSTTAVQDLGTSTDIIYNSTEGLIILVSTATGTRPSVIGSTSKYAPGGTTIALDTPSGAVANDYLVAVVQNQSSTFTTDITMPSGSWTRIGPPFVSASSEERVNGFYGMRVTAGMLPLPASYTFTMPASGFRITGSLVLVRGVNSSVLADFAAINSPTATDNIPTMVSMDSPYNSCLGLVNIHTITTANNDGSLVPGEIPGAWVQLQSYSGPTTWTTASADWQHLYRFPVDAGSVSSVAIHTVGSTIAVDATMAIILRGSV